MPFGPTHLMIRSLATYALHSFFSDIQVYGEEFVPLDGEGPAIVLANHWNGAVDPAILSCYFPHSRKLHYWAKSTLFKMKFAAAVLLDAGNIPVDRRNKDNQKLFASTFDMLKLGECVAIFPEGGSYTYPGFGTFKDGASWAALEYAKNMRITGRQLSTGGEAPEDPKEVSIMIAGFTYTDKSKYRSSVLVQFGPSITVTPFVEEFLTDPRSAVKALTKAIQEALTKVTVNSPDWDTLNAANMARKILWVDERTIPLAQLRNIGQTLVDHFTPSEKMDQKLATLRTLLLEYQKALRATRLTHYSLSGVALPSTLDPAVPHPLPTRFRVIAHLFLSSMSSLIRLPFFILPLIVHIPIYLISKYSLRFSHLEEDHAQNKIALGLVLAFLTYPALFAIFWCLLFLTPIGGILAFGFVWLFAVYHNTIVDDNYNAAKRLVASWRILVGIWAPHAKSEAVHALSILGFEEKVEGENEIRRVLRLRLEAAKALGEYLEGLEEAGGDRVLLPRKVREWKGKFKTGKK